MLQKLAQRLFGQGGYDEFELLETERGAPGTPQPLSAQQKSAPGLETVAAQAGFDPKKKLSGDIESDMAMVGGALFLPRNKDVIQRQFVIKSAKRACVFYMNGMADANLIDDFILKQSMNGGSEQKQIISMDYFLENIAAIGEFSLTELLSVCVYDVLCGKALVLLDGETRGVIFDTRGFEHRSIPEPKIEKVLRGPNEAFTEALRTNITLIRRIIKTSDLMFEFVQLGGNNNLSCAIAYRRGFTNQKLINEVKKRIQAVKTNYILGEGMLEQFAQRRRFSLISRSLITERPDRAAIMLMEGHVAVLCDGSPFAQVVPVSFGALMSSPDDAYMRSSFVLASRVSRIFGFIVCVFVPGLYIAITKFHQGVISTELINTILTARRMVSMPVEAELLLLLTVFQLVKESGMRVPGEMGQSLSVISALVLGQASVSANLTSAIMLIVVAGAGLGNYSIPDVSLQLTANLYQLLLIAAASISGFFGIALATAALSAYLFSLKSYGVPLFAPFAPKARNAFSFDKRGRQRLHVEPEDAANQERQN